MGWHYVNTPATVLNHILLERLVYELMNESKYVVQMKLYVNMITY